ncbi:MULTISPECIES: LLM class flavin-dependent oxidoreductase [unclassified Streptomyces]|uniref:LLM class flavin-dependent oxidoreductase n=1 Tax=unclassified Streptomyces TaxID=2593676 RepID=UPI0016609C63|nr:MULTISPECIES: LLM class flavin-dependent oxidoreductase [unclassified Streptomyces]MBD0706883.1 5,10-methylene tetrahydromethanopterin reductase [Streptomyces sp. CBMA291]MBD0715019.1 5,10-methylene tetrahydromethanopterin reductase [Streptomyces sp. CBMA370]
MTSYSVLVPFLPRRPEQVLPYAGLVHWTQAERLWQGQGMLLETHQAFAHAAGAGFRVPVGLGVTLMPLRHPFEAAMQARSLAMATGHPVIAGFGPGSKSMQRSLLGRPYASPLTAAREYLTAVRGLLANEIVDVKGEYVTCHGALSPFPAPPVELGLGVLRPGMARLAGEVADVAITWLTPASYLRDVVRPAMSEGAAAAGRAVPRLTAIVPVALEHEGHEPARIALASNSAHLKGPHYIDMLRRADVGVGGEDPTVDAQALVDGGAFLSGDVQSVLAKLRQYEEAGVDEIVLNVTGVHHLVGAQAATADLKTILSGALSSSK